MVAAKPHSENIQQHDSLKYGTKSSKANLRGMMPIAPVMRQNESDL
jgi:hypothetical protein